MKDWVRPSLRKLRPETVSPEIHELELAENRFVWRALADCFQHNFRGNYMKDLIGSTLCELEEEVFRKLTRSRVVFFLASGLAWIHRFNPVEGGVTLILFTEEILYMPLDAARGTVCHEVAHFILQDLDKPFSLDDPFNLKREARADELCKTWGFASEIREGRVYLENQKKGGFEQ